MPSAIHLTFPTQGSRVRHTSRAFGTDARLNELLGNRTSVVLIASVHVCGFPYTNVEQSARVILIMNEFTSFMDDVSPMFLDSIYFVFSINHNRLTHRFTWTCHGVVYFLTICFKTSPQRRDCGTKGRTRPGRCSATPLKSTRDIYNTRELSQRRFDGGQYKHKMLMRHFDY